MSGEADNGEHGVEHLQAPTLTIVVDPRTGVPSFTCTQGPIAFWQMMVDEVGRQLEEQRRAAAVVKLRESLAESARTQAVLDRVAKNPRGD